MNLKDIEAFVAVATYLNYSDAARKCYISQPTLSQRVTAMEKEYAVKLFQRTSRNVSLTKEGEELLPYAKEILESVSQMERKVREFSDKSVLTIAMANYISDYSAFDISSILLRFIQNNPDISVMTTELTPEECISCLETGEADIAIVPTYDFESQRDNLTSAVIQNCPLAVATGNRECKTMEEVFDKTTFILENFPGSELINQELKTVILSINPNAKFCSDQAIGFVESLITSPNYSSMCPEVYLQKRYYNEISFFKHEKFQMTMQLAALYKNNKTNKATRRFLKQLT